MKEFFAGRLLAKPLAAGEIAFRPRRLEAMVRILADFDFCRSLL
ncbi:MAG TPA: hypothetical protein PKK11_08470 [Methanothrix sp.]|nr:hypothetical protein [Methanothrix sp.]